MGFTIALQVGAYWINICEYKNNMLKKRLFSLQIRYHWLAQEGRISNLYLEIRRTYVIMYISWIKRGSISCLHFMDKRRINKLFTYGT